MCSEMKKLKELDLSGCGLEELPANFSHLTQLTKLDLAWNKELQRLSVDMCSKMKKLEVLDLSGCGLKELPANFGELTELRNFYCEGNPLTRPPMAVCRQGMDAIRAYFVMMVEKRKTDKLKRFKIILLGEPCSGKTSLIQTMINKKSTCTNEDDRTIGVDEWELTLSDNNKAKVLDCGGQRSYLLTNQLFVSENTLICIVVDINKYQLTKESFHQHIGQYLQVVYERCQRVQVLIVFTKVDCLPGQFSRWMKSLFRDSLPPEFLDYQREVSGQLKALTESRKRLQKTTEGTCFSGETLAFIRSQNIKIRCELIFASAKPFGTVKTLRKVIDKLAEDRAIFPTVDDVIPTAWLDFEQKLVKTSAESELSIMDLPRVTELGIQHGLTEEHVKIVLSYFHQVGTVLYFPHPRLSNVVFGSCRKLVDVLKEIFCHDDSKRQYHKGRAEIYQSQQQFEDDKQKLVDNGIITILLLKALLGSLSLSRKSLNVVINMLLTFDFAYVRGSRDLAGLTADEMKLDSENVLHQLEQAEASFLLPWLLTEKCPASVSKQFLTVCPKLWVEVKIFFSFGLSLPLGIFERFSARCHRHSEFIQHWDSGFMLKYGPVMAQFTRESGENDPGIHCRCRVPKSMNALFRLFHVLWRCVIDLTSLLKTVPGCVYETFLDFLDGEEMLKRQKFRVAEEWTLVVSHGLTTGRTLKECIRAVDNVVLSAVKRKLSLTDTFSDVLGQRLISSSTYLTHVAMEVERHHSDHLALLALSLYMDQEKCGGAVGTLLKKWQEERGDGAVVATLCDALQQCGLETVRRKCFLGIHDVEQSQGHLLPEDFGMTAAFPPKGDPISSHRDLIMAVAKVGNDQWMTIPSHLGLEHFEINDVPVYLPHNSDRLRHLIERWSSDKDTGATVGRLLDACKRSGTSLHEVHQEYSKYSESDQ